MINFVSALIQQIRNTAGTVRALILPKFAFVITFVASNELFFCPLSLHVYVVWRPVLPRRRKGVSGQWTRLPGRLSRPGSALQDHFKYAGVLGIHQCGASCCSAGSACVDSFPGKGGRQGATSPAVGPLRKRRGGLCTAAARRGAHQGARTVSGGRARLPVSPVFPRHRFVRTASVSASLNPFLVWWVCGVWGAATGWAWMRRMLQLRARHWWRAACESGASAGRAHIIGDLDLERGSAVGHRARSAARASGKPVIAIARTT